MGEFMNLFHWRYNKHLLYFIVIGYYRRSDIPEAKSTDAFHKHDKSANREIAIAEYYTW